MSPETLRVYLASGGIALFAFASFVFALSETAIFSLGKWRVRQLAEQDPRRGGCLLRLLNRPQDLLATIVLGNTVANAGLIGIALWVALTGEWPVAYTVGGTLLLILLGCEVIPKTLAVRSPDRWSLRLAESMSRLMAVSQPVHSTAQRVNAFLMRWMIPRSMKPQVQLTDEEYQELVELAFQQGTLAATEKEIISQIIALDRRTATEVMKPRSQMACISDELTVEEMIQAARKHKHRRLPIYDETPDTIVGVLNTRALLLNPEADLSEVIEFPSFVPESMNLLQLFRSLQRQQRGMAIVLDEFGSTAGIVTMEDILEEVVGEVHSEGEAQGLVMERVRPGVWRVNATMRLDDFRREYPPLGEVPEVETMGGLLMMLLSVVPARGDSATFCGLKLTATDVDERRVRQILVETTRR